MLQTLLQILDAVVGFPCGFDVIADSVEQYVTANRIINSLKWI